jgi:hypothetical protein
VHGQIAKQIGKEAALRNRILRNQMVEDEQKGYLKLQLRREALEQRATLNHTMKVDREDKKYKKKVKQLKRLDKVEDQFMQRL